MIVLLKKYSPSSLCWPNLLKSKGNSGLVIEEILQKYEGFEGELIEFWLSFASPFDLEKIYRKSEGLLLLFACPDNPIHLPLLSQFSLVGYDFGVCEDDKTIYSSIFNEILFGNIEQLISCQTYLNDHLLFPTRDLAEQYSALHHDLLILGEDVEDDADMKIYEIWKAD